MCCSTPICFPALLFFVLPTLFPALILFFQRFRAILYSALLLCVQRFYFVSSRWLVWFGGLVGASFFCFKSLYFCFQLASVPRGRYCANLGMHRSAQTSIQQRIDLFTFKKASFQGFCVSEIKYDFVHTSAAMPSPGLLSGLLLFPC